MPCWPSPQDYAEAIQTPLLSLADSELRAGQVELNAFGLPRCLSGAFATVFCMQCDGKKVAVRCFLSDIKEQEERYAEISKFVLSDSLPYTVAFEYQKRGIQVNGEWYPILKMEWVDGVTLATYLEKVKDPDIFGMLAGYFKQMTLELNRAGISHGDLQHDNILIQDLELRLVDYDGMYVPSLKGRQASELGHRNYQHPERISSFFEASLDNFSAWVIYTSLKCLALDPSLCKQLDAGADCLLFRRSDFVSLGESRAFEILDAHENEKVRRYAQVVKQLVSMPPSEVPTLDTPLQAKVVLCNGKGDLVSAGSGDSEEQLERFATDEDYNDESLQVALAEPESAVPLEPIEANGGGAQSVQKLPALRPRDSYYPALSLLDLGEPSPGDYFNVEAVLEKQLMPGETIQWSSSYEMIKVPEPPNRSRTSTLGGLMLMVVIPGVLGLMFGAIPLSPGLLLCLSVIGIVVCIGLMGAAVKERNIYLLTNERLILTKFGHGVHVHSIPLEDIEKVKVYSYQGFGSSPTAEVYAKTSFRTKDGRFERFNIACPDSLAFVRSLRKDVRVIEVQSS